MGLRPAPALVGALLVWEDYASHDLARPVAVTCSGWVPAELVQPMRRGATGTCRAGPSNSGDTTMTTALGIVLAVLFAVLGIAKLASVPAMRAAATHLGYTTDQYRVIGALEIAGASAARQSLVVLEPSNGVVRPYPRYPSLPLEPLAPAAASWSASARARTASITTYSA